LIFSIQILDSLPLLVDWQYTHADHGRQATPEASSDARCIAEQTCEVADRIGPKAHSATGDYRQETGMGVVREIRQPSYTIVSMCRECAGARHLLRGGSCTRLGALRARASCNLGPFTVP